MAIQIADQFSYSGVKPLDARFQYATVADMKAAAEASLYDGCFAYVKATKKYYSFDSNNTVDTTTGRWREFSSGGSGGTSDYTELSNKPQINGYTLTGNRVGNDIGLQNTTLSTPITIRGTEYTSLETALAALKNPQMFSDIEGLAITSGSTVSDFEYYIKEHCYKNGALKPNAHLDYILSIQCPNVKFTAGEPEGIINTWMTANYYVYCHAIADSNIYNALTNTGFTVLVYCFKTYTENNKSKCKLFTKEFWCSSSGTWTGTTWYEIGSLPIASANELGGVKIGNGLAIESDGTLSTSGVPMIGTINRSDIYDATEKVIGCHVNGKPIYQKTLTCTIPDKTTRTNTYSLTSLKIDDVIDVQSTSTGTLMNTPIGYLGFTSGTSETYYNAVEIFANSESLSVRSINYFSSGQTVYVTLRYTKTTDAANSYNYADENDYSTSEKIVGTWIDGKKLYQKTFTGTFPATISNNYYFSIPLGVTVSEVISIKGSAKWVDSSLSGWGLIPSTDGRVNSSNKTLSFITVYSNGNSIDMIVGGDNRTLYQSQPYRVTVQYTK